MELNLEEMRFNEILATPKLVFLRSNEIIGTPKLVSIILCRNLHLNFLRATLFQCQS